ncbi:ArsR family transcriptional regulator [Flavimobilis marinus]|uniref:Predicted transcriptional regulator, ArsR family n=1 Tax=Flavimobilis marinus TaxID=285351 RepID=A0A1I2FJX9_9MICO|nr:helix-turn-helix domain-containing protein [Flavimobilis marinus]GHG51965.1 ArsR family transcriptional regulator [Flavimobilis marinus]SFF05068.1 Predicted transcriptional regulator, ArsR family [Flavimobilis marinus]
MIESRTDDARHGALAAPARRALLALLQGSPDAASAAELAAGLGLHVTTVRFHLEQLEHAGLVRRSVERSGRRGRPAVRYRSVEADLVAARSEMIDALADVAAAGGPAPADEARRAGERWGASVDVPPGDALELTTHVLTRLGFEPEPAGDRLDLRGCPFRAAARRNQQVVCQIHLGLARAVAARADDGASVDVQLLPFVEPTLCQLTLTPTRSTP